MVQPTIEETGLSTEQAIKTYREGARITDVDTLVVKGLSVYYETESGTVKAVDDVSFTLKQGERFALVGESGSGKTTLAMALMRLTRPPGHIAKGSIILNNRDLTTLSEEEMRRARLSELALVPQGAMNSLNPVMRIEKQIIDGIVDHLDDDETVTKDQLRETVRDLLTRVGLRPDVARMFPHELSGGMKQRVAMAIGISLRPKLIIADEPTSALDVVVQRQIMQTLGRLQEGLDASIMLVGHDMGLVAQFADTIGVMYAGKLVEVGPVEEVFSDPKHPYTKLLIQSLPSLQEKKDFVGIPGLPPLLIHLPQGCAFEDRCPSRFEKCPIAVPEMRGVGNRREVACYLYEDEDAS
ncbi:MAG: ABC transporter ATP-binding protein [Chloroflexi bacterium]|nr:ABC transporter ATP-binding protein [Chloroflexota bacterium]MCI0774260.1 ABC transporter ATP-binding protein [Chloroflexota bacterium]MCI0836322.1 ABC transporter ATP-binding protein [Chloroflexota bacterium]MCI0851252.1 ABC transporter ATP-binding protein [Chloroflexota bacterium]MCI0872739.1 ABC transporter ATP-binding protein [Chloroflexota bacterium]